MRRHLIRALLVGGAIAATVALGTGQAFAAGTITITGAGTTFSATSGNAVLSDVDSGQNFACPTTIGGSLANVSDASLPYTATQADGSPHSITSAAGCPTGSITVTPDLPWDIVFTTSTSGFVQGANPAGILFHVSELTCTFDVAGEADFTWTDGTVGQLTLTGEGSLTPVDIGAGCFGMVNAGDVVTFTAGYTFSPNTITVGP